MFTHTCEICGDTFESASNRAKYCVHCRDRAQVLRNKAYREKKFSGESVALGSEQTCPMCNKTYTVTSGSQKYCKECRKKQRNASKAVDPQYLKDNYEYIRMNISEFTFQRDSVMKLKLMHSPRDLA